MSDDAKVIGLHGQPVRGTPNAKIVEALEQLLEAAKEGRIVAIAVADVMHDGTGRPLLTGHHYAVGQATGNALFAALGQLTFHYGKYLFGEHDDA